MFNHIYTGSFKPEPLKIEFKTPDELCESRAIAAMDIVKAMLKVCRLDRDRFPVPDLPGSEQDRTGKASDTMSQGDHK